MTLLRERPLTDALWAYTGKPRAGTPRHAVDTEDADRTRGDRLLCARCRIPVTSEDARIEVHDRHEHDCVNPHGLTFHIGCFAAAPGCVGVGAVDSQWSWFPGYGWQIAICRACHRHLGWVFRAAGARFYGLILDRLVPEEGDPDA